MKRFIPTRLSWKLITVIVSVILFLMLIQTVVTTLALRQDLISSLAEKTFEASEIVKNSTRYSMLLNLKSDVNKILQNIATKDGITSIKIYDKLGVVTYASDSLYLNKSVDIQNEICQPCHRPQIPLTNLSVNDRTQIRDVNGVKELFILNPIENSPDCSTSECHESQKTSSILGIMEMSVPLKSIDTIVDKNVSTVLIYIVGGTLLLALLTAVFINIFINRPLRKISQGIHVLSGGDLSYRLPVSGKDELAEVAMQLNDMSGKLQNAYDEIKGWNETLNIKIEEKTHELKNIYTQVNQIEKLASLGKLSATVAHELNNPLAGILTFSKLIIRKIDKMPKTDELTKINNHLTMIAEEADRCGRIVKDLLLFSHKGDDEFVRENLCMIADRAIQLIDHHLHLHKITLEKEYQYPEILVDCNPQKIQQALLSLSINAIEAMEEGKTLRVSITRESDKVIVRIRDEGSGIDEKILPTIFEPFVTTKESGKGTGLGLSVVYGIISAHSGKIEVEETSLAGTTFKITLHSPRELPV